MPTINTDPQRLQEIIRCASTPPPDEVHLGISVVMSGYINLGFDSPELMCLRPGSEALVNKLGKGLVQALRRQIAEMSDDDFLEVFVDRISVTEVRNGNDAVLQVIDESAPACHRQRG